MTPNEYQELAMRTNAPQHRILNRLVENGIPDMQLINGVIGLTNDVGELAEPIKKHIEYGQALDVVNIKEEVGDVLWRLAQICDAVELTLEECMEKNIAKLSKRYPEKFTDEAALNRDLKAERIVLEDKIDSGVEFREE